MQQKVRTRELAQLLGLKPKTLDNWRSLGKGPPYYEVGGRIVYDPLEASAWLATRRRTSTSDPGPQSPS